MNYWNSNEENFSAQNVLLEKLQEVYGMSASEALEDIEFLKRACEPAELS